MIFFENFEKNHQHQSSKIFQKVIKSEPEVRKQPVNNIFRFQNILMVIFESKLISVGFKEKKTFFLQNP